MPLGAGAEDVLALAIEDIRLTGIMDMPLAVAALPDALGGGVDVLASALERIEDAWLRETVVVVGGGGRLLPLLRTSSPNELGTTSRKASSGPATIALLCRCTALPFSGWSSDVIQIATTPLIPEGTTHWSIGREIEAGRPPANIWQKKPCGRGACVRNMLLSRLVRRLTEVLPLRAGELNCNEVPTPMAPVVVIERDGLADNGRQFHREGPGTGGTYPSHRARSLR